MAQEFIINSQTLEDKVNDLLPSQAGFGAGVDLSASTQIIPIVDLTEAASGSGLREDLQKSFAHGNTTVVTATSNQDVSAISTTGYFKVLIQVSADNYESNGVGTYARVYLDDGTTEKNLIDLSTLNSGVSPGNTSQSFELMVYIAAGEELRIQADSNVANRVFINCASRQIADLQGNLQNPS